MFLSVFVEEEEQQQKQIVGTVQCGPKLTRAAMLTALLPTKFEVTKSSNYSQTCTPLERQCKCQTYNSYSSSPKGKAQPYKSSLQHKPHNIPNRRKKYEEGILIDSVTSGIIESFMHCCVVADNLRKNGWFTKNAAGQLPCCTAFIATNDQKTQRPKM